MRGLGESRLESSTVGDLVRKSPTPPPIKTKGPPYTIVDLWKNPTVLNPLSTMTLNYVCLFSTYDNL